MEKIRETPYKHTQLKPFTDIKSWWEGESVFAHCINLLPKKNYNLTNAVLWKLNTPVPTRFYEVFVLIGLVFSDCDGQSVKYLQFWVCLSEGHLSRSLVIGSGATLKTCCQCLFEKRSFLLQPLKNKPHLFSLNLIPWNLTFDMLAEACRIWDTAFGLFVISLRMH